MVSLGIYEETGVDVSCFTWVNTNRIALGHTDGSITLWSLHPRRCLLRQLVHHTEVMHMSSGYPSQPYHIASTPVSGFYVMVDLKAPSYENTANANSVIALQPNLLQWSDHFQGWFSLYPSSNPLNTSLIFSNIRYFPHTRAAFSGDSILSCMAVGTMHPFMLVGQMDGSVWACNPIKRVLAKKGVKAYKIKLFQNEYRPAELFSQSTGENGRASGERSDAATTSVRGACRIIQGWGAEINENHLGGKH